MMPGSSDYIRLDSLVTDMEGGTEEFSDVEDLSATYDRFDAPKDYWFGKKYFECILAQALLRQTHDSDAIPTLDVSCRTMIFTVGLKY